MIIKVLKTSEIDHQTWIAITQGFNESFDRAKTADEFIAYYKNTALNYSFHALAYAESGELAGSTTIIPHRYSVAGELVLFGLSGGTFVRKAFRSDIFILSDMFEALRPFCAKEGMKVIYGVPNNNSYKYSIKFLKQKYLMDLRYYIVPLKIGTILDLNHRFILNSFSSIFCSFLRFFNNFLSQIVNFVARKSRVAIVFNNDFVTMRFKNGYIVNYNDDFFYAYKIVVEKGVNTAYLMEYREKEIRTYKALTKAINDLSRVKALDLIIFAGTISHRQFNMLRVPHKKIPHKLPLVYEFIGNLDDNFQSVVSNKESWDFSLVNFDVR